MPYLDRRPTNWQLLPSIVKKVARKLKLVLTHQYFHLAPCIGKVPKLHKFLWHFLYNIMCHNIVNTVYRMENRRLALPNSLQTEVSGSCKQGNKLSGSVKCGEFLEFLRTY
jgi:hypothetical protein